MDPPQTCILKMNIDCEKCQKEIKSILQRIHGVYTINIDADQNKVSVSGNVDPNILLMVLARAGKNAQILYQQAYPPPPPPPQPQPQPQPGHPLESHFWNFHMAPPPPPAAPPKEVAPPPKSVGPFAQLQQFAELKNLRHLEMTQTRGIKMTFNGQDHVESSNRMGHSSNTDQHMRFFMDNGGGGGGGGGVHGHTYAPAAPPHSYHEIRYNCGGGGGAAGLPSVTHSAPAPAPAPTSARQPDPFQSFFSDENPNGCSVM